MLKPLTTPRNLMIFYALVALLVTVAAIMPRMGFNSMWHDEVNMINQSLTLDMRDFYNQTRMNSAYSSHPPLYFMLIKGWSWLAGDHDIVFRVISVWAGLLSVAFTFRMAADFGRQAFAGLAAGVLLGIMPIFVTYAQTNHNYTLYLVFSLGLCFFALRWWKSPAHKGYAIGVVLCTVGLQYTHYYGAFLILAINIYALVTGVRQRHTYLRWLLLQGLAFLLITPWIPVVLRLAGGDYDRTGEQVALQISSYPTSVEGVETLFRELLYNQWWLYAALIVLGLVLAWWLPKPHRLWQACLFIGVLLLVSLLIALAVNTQLQSLSYRRMIFMAGLLAILIGSLMTAFPRWLRWGSLVVILIFTWNAPFLEPGNWNYRQGVELINEQAQPDDVALFFFSGDLEVIPFRYYAEHLLREDVPFSMQLDDAAHFENYLWARDRLWIAWADNAPPVLSQMMLERQFTGIETYELGWYHITLLTAPTRQRGTMPQAAAVEKISLPQTFGRLLQLTDYQLDKISGTPGEQVTLWLDWQALHRPDQDYGVYVHLIEDDFVTLHGQLDGSPSHWGRGLPTRYWAVSKPVYDAYTFTINPDTSPGIYNIKIGLYSYLTPLRLPAAPGDGINSDGVVIAQFEVK